MLPSLTRYLCSCCSTLLCLSVIWEALHPDTRHSHFWISLGFVTRLKIQNPVLEIVMQTIFLHTFGRTRPGSVGKQHKNLFPLRGKRAFLLMFVTNVYGQLHRNHCCMNGSIRLITDPEKSRVETSLATLSVQLGHHVSGQIIHFATQCPLEVSVLFMNRYSMLRMLCKR